MHHILSVTPIHVDAAELDRRRRRYHELARTGSAWNWWTQARAHPSS
ncbi:MAG TPA: hypothetical protein VG674_10420 [Amycolatopsis sp.]|nr:hypothetical protein [Amycolatopsis sp.]